MEMLSNDVEIRHPDPRAQYRHKTFGAEPKQILEKSKISHLNAYMADAVTMESIWHIAPATAILLGLPQGICSAKLIITECINALSLPPSLPQCCHLFHNI